MVIYKCTKIFKVTDLNLYVPILVLLMVVLPLIYIPGSWSHTIIIRYLFILGLSIIALLIFLIDRMLFIDRNNIPLYFFLFFTLLSTLYSKYPFEAWIGMPVRFTGYLSYVIFFILYMFAFGVASKHPGVVDRIVNMFLYSASFIAFLGLLQYFGLDLIAFGKNIFQVSKSYSTIGNSNHLGSYLLIAFPFAGYYFLKDYRSKSKVQYALIFGALLTTLSRGAWLGLVVGMAFYLIWFPLRKRIKSLLLISILVTLFILPFNDWGLVKQVGTLPDEAELAVSGDPEAGSARFLLWQESINALPKSLVIGTGPDTLLYIAKEKFEERFYEGYPAKAHNIYLEIAVTLGFPALIFYLWFLFSLMHKTNLKDPFLSAFYAMIIIYLAQGIFLVDVLTVYPLFWVLTGFYGGLKTNKVKNLI